MLSFKTTSQKTVYQDKWFKLHVDHLRNNQGGEADYTYGVRAQGGGTTIIPYIEKTNSFLLVEQYRHPIRKTVWQFPGGTRDKNESFIDAAKKELLEETGYQCEEFIDLGIFYPDVGILSDEGKIFLALNPLKIAEPKIHDSTEHTVVKEFSQFDIERLIENGSIRDGWTLGAFTLFNLWIKKK